VNDDSEIGAFVERLIAEMAPDIIINNDAADELCKFIIDGLPGKEPREIMAIVAAEAKAMRDRVAFKKYVLSVAERCGDIQDHEPLGDALRRVAATGDAEAQSLLDGGTGNFAGMRMPHFTLQ
jgi:hypothetical protein